MLAVSISSCGLKRRADILLSGLQGLPVLRWMPCFAGWRRSRRPVEGFSVHGPFPRPARKWWGGVSFSEDSTSEGGSPYLRRARYVDFGGKLGGGAAGGRRGGG